MSCCVLLAYLVSLSAFLDEVKSLQSNKVRSFLPIEQHCTLKIATHDCNFFPPDLAALDYMEIMKDSYNEQCNSVTHEMKN